MLLFLVLIFRALYLQVFNDSFFREQGQARHKRQLTLFANRGMITDRNGEPLAISTPVQSIWVTPKGMPELSDKQLTLLAEKLGMTKQSVMQRLADKRKDFVYLRRQLTPAQAQEVKALNLPGIFAQTEYRRYYPAGEVMAHIIGFTNIDGRGQEGLELTRDKTLAGKAGSRTVIKDRHGYIVEDISSIIPPQNGETLCLSIDQRIQYLAYRELKNMVDLSAAKAGATVVLDAKTGEVLALVNLPTYNPNSRAAADLAAKRNRALTDANEPGSGMKAFVAAAALESGQWKPLSKVNTGQGKFATSGFTITDTSPHGVITVEEMVKYSSNIAAAKIGESLSREFMWNFYRNLGFGEAPHTEFPGETKGRLRPWKTWYPVEQMTMSYGYGISASLMQLAKAYQAFATQGEIRPISLYKVVAPPEGKRVMSARTALAVRKMLERVMEPGGTGKRMQIPGYRVAAKTGTARKSERGGYSRRYIGSMIGLAPASNPRLIVAVMIDEPTKGSYFGGLTAGPVFKEVMAGALRTLDITPDAPLTELNLQDNSVDDVREGI
jgi:cell division protein FtsI (penicillin-binding protein 3)